MKAIKRILGIILVLISLYGCSSLDGVLNMPSNTTPAGTLVQTLTLTPFDIATPTDNATPVRTPPAETSTLTFQQTTATPDLIASVTLGACLLSPVTQPPRPTKTFHPNELDSETGLHVTGLSQWIDLSTYRLIVTGLVNRPLSLTYDDIRCMPKVTDNPELICPGVFTDDAYWTGVPIKYILELAGVQQEATEVILVSADRYEVKLPLEAANTDKNFLAYEVNGTTLPVEHGFPLRAVFPSMWGSYWLKWLVEIRIS